MELKSEADCTARPELEFGTSAMDFVLSHPRNMFKPRALVQLFTLPLELQQAVVLQGSLNKPIFRDKTGALIGRARNAREADPIAIHKLVQLPNLQEHVAWSFMQLRPEKQRCIMERSWTGVKNINAVLMKRLQCV